MSTSKIASKIVNTSCIKCKHGKDINLSRYKSLYELNVSYLPNMKLSCCHSFYERYDIFMNYYINNDSCNVLNILLSIENDTFDYLCSTLLISGIEKFYVVAFMVWFDFDELNDLIKKLCKMEMRKNEQSKINW